MPNYLYYGKIGDGKTYHVVERELLPAIRRRRHVYTNIASVKEPDKLRAIEALTGVPWAEVDELITYWPTAEVIREQLDMMPDDKAGVSLKLKKGSLVIIDEVQDAYHSREFKNTSRGFMFYLTYHRHWGMDNVFISQAPGQVEKAIIRVLNFSYQIKNLNFLSSIMGNRYVMNVRQTPQDPVVATLHGKFNPDIFRCYESTQLRTEDKRRVPTYLSQPAQLLIIPLMAFGFYRIARHGFIPRMEPKQEVGKDGNSVHRDSALRDSLASGATRVVGDLGPTPSPDERVRDAYERGGAAQHFDRDENGCYRVPTTQRMTFIMGGVVDQVERPGYRLECPRKA